MKVEGSTENSRYVKKLFWDHKLKTSKYKPNQTKPNQIKPNQTKTKINKTKQKPKTKQNKTKQSKKKKKKKKKKKMYDIYQHRWTFILIYYGCPICPEKLRKIGSISRPNQSKVTDSIRSPIDNCDKMVAVKCLCITVSLSKATSLAIGFFPVRQQ